MTDNEKPFDNEKSLADFDKAIDEIVADPEAFRQEVYDDVIARKGQKWFDENKSYIDADFEGVRALMGF